MNRAACLGQLGDFEGAVRDTNRAVQLNTRNASAYMTRSRIFENMGRHDEALNEINLAIQLDPRNPDAYVNRAAMLVRHLGFRQALEDLAAEDFLLSLRINPEDIWSALFLYFSRLESGISGTDELRKNTQSLDMKAWPGPIIALCLGKIPETAVIDAARHPNTSIEKGQLCHAFYHLGKHHLIKGNLEIAEGHFNQCIETMVTGSIEWHKAKIALSKIGEF